MDLKVRECVLNWGWLVTLAGMRSEKEGYEGLIEASSMVAKNFGSKGQQDLVIQALHKAFPSLLLNMASSLFLSLFLSSWIFLHVRGVMFSLDGNNLYI